MITVKKINGSQITKEYEGTFKNALCYNTNIKTSITILEDKKILIIR